MQFIQIWCHLKWVIQLLFFHHFLYKNNSITSASWVNSCLWKLLNVILCVCVRFVWAFLCFYIFFFMISFCFSFNISIVLYLQSRLKLFKLFNQHKVWARKKYTYFIFSFSFILCKGQREEYTTHSKTAI